MLLRYKKTRNYLLILLIAALLNCSTNISALTGEDQAHYLKRYKEAIYNEKELAHYLSKVNNYFLVEPMKNSDIATLVKLYNDNVTIANDITAYYQNQLMRSELFWKSRTEKMTADQMRNALSGINPRINMLVSKYVDSIAAFERENAYNFGGMTGTSPATWGPDHPRGDNVDTWEQLTKEERKAVSGSPAKRLKGRK